MCSVMGDDCKIHFIPSRRCWIPCHVKFDTETVLEMFTPNKRRIEWRKSFGEDRKSFNWAVWDTLLDVKTVKKKSRCFDFHHEITTDGVSVSFEGQAYEHHKAYVVSVLSKYTTGKSCGSRSWEEKHPYHV